MLHCHLKRTSAENSRLTIAITNKSKTLLVNNLQRSERKNCQINVSFTTKPMLIQGVVKMPRVIRLRLINNSRNQLIKNKVTKISTTIMFRWWAMQVKKLLVQMRMSIEEILSFKTPSISSCRNWGKIWMNRNNSLTTNSKPFREQIKNKIVIIKTQLKRN